MMKLLVCGGAGFIGTNFVHYMFEMYPEITIVVYDKLTYAGNLQNLTSIFKNNHYHFIQGDIVDLPLISAVVARYDISHIINFAAETHVDRSIHQVTKEFVLTNTLGVQVLLEIARIHAISKFINVSTDEVYGSLRLFEKTAFTESTPIMPNMPYAAAKAGGDLMCNAYWVTHHVPVIVTHCSNNYGPYQFPEKLIPFFMFKLLKNEKVPVYGDGQNVRDWIHVRDHVRALDLLLQKGQPGEVYNIGANNERSNLEITRLLLSLFGLDEEQIEYIEDRPGHDRRYAVDASKLSKLGWHPEYPAEKFELGLQETIEWYRNNSTWVEYIWQKKRNEINVFQFGLKRINK